MMQAENAAAAGMGGMAMPGLGAGMIANMMQQEGPIVQTVLLRTDGSSTQLAVDMSPRENAICQILGGPTSFLGQLLDLKVVVMMRLQQDGLPTNTHRLPQPLDQAGLVRGDLLLVRMDEGAQPQDFLLQEYQTYFGMHPPRV